MPLILPLPLFAQAAVEAPAAPTPAGPTVEDDRLRLCVEQAARDGAGALAAAGAWLAESSGAARARPLQCLGHVYAALLRWDAAETAFVQAAEALGGGDPPRLAALRAQAGNAALAGGHPERALAHLDAALAQPGGAPVERAQLQLDRSRALVGLDRLDAAVEAIAAAQRDAPDEPLAWLLGAALARRRGDLAAAQRQIEVAASLAPHDPEIGLEAGVIAVLGGREDAARKSWEAVRLLAPASPAAAAAKAYLAQLADPAGSPEGR